MKAIEIFPLPPATGHDAQIFRAPRYWQANVCGAAIAGAGGALLFLVLGGILIGLTGRIGPVSAILILVAVGAPLALFPGKISTVWPYAVGIEHGKGLRFYTPLKDIYVPLEDVSRVKWSWLLA